jgi:mannose-6-phosphate isomerase-like protein (cupin superfamily)
MSMRVPSFPDSVVVRSDQAERIGRPPTTVHLLADSSATGAAMSTIRASLADGADGASPHHHATAAELFYVLDGTAQLLSGEQILTAGRGDLVPPNMAHAFAAAPGHNAELLIVIAPGVERFEYFRHLERIAHGKVPPESLLEVQDRYDTYFQDSPAWEAARAATR